MDQPLSVETIEPVLRGRFGHPLRYYPSIGSTNVVAMGWASEGAPEGAVVGADHQTAGRGRWGRTWSSAPGNLLQTSTILRPMLPVSEAGVITTAVGIACARAVEEVASVEVGMKWPNDVNVHGKKVAGILLESHVDDAGRIDIAVAGVGINVNWDVADMPEEIRDRATSISVITGKPVARLQLLASFLYALETVYGLTKEGRGHEVIAEAVMRSDVLGKAVTIRFLDGSTIAGRAVGIDPSGALRLETEEAERTIQIGEIEQLRPL